MTHPALGSLSEEETLFHQTVRKFAEREILPIRRRMDEQANCDPELIPKLFEMGLLGIEISENHGGLGGSFMMSCLAIEEISRIDGAIGLIVDLQNTLIVRALNQYGTEAQKSKYLPKIAKSWLGSYALSESSSGSEAFALKLRARDQGDRHACGKEPRRPGRPGPR